MVRLTHTSRDYIPPPSHEVNPNQRLIRAHLYGSQLLKCNGYHAQLNATEI